MRKTACPVVWELYRAKSRYGDPIAVLEEKIFSTQRSLRERSPSTRLPPSFKNYGGHGRAGKTAKKLWIAALQCRLSSARIGGELRVLSQRTQ